jgi:hypothetical protein
VEFQVIIQEIAMLTLIFQDVLQKLKVISTRLSELEKEKTTKHLKKYFVSLNVKIKYLQL